MMKTKSDLISVIIPAYNSEKYIEEAICSVRSQRDVKAKIIVVDDESTDNTVNIAKKLECDVIVEKHKGAAAARNKAIPEIRTPFVFFLDSDDVLTDKAFSYLLAEFSLNPELVAVFGMTTDFISPELTESKRLGLFPRKQPYGGILPGCGLLKKEIVDKVGLFNESLSPGEVIDWMMRLREVTTQIRQIDYVTLHRRIHQNNSGRINKLQESQNYAAILRARIKKK